MQPTCLHKSGSKTHHSSSLFHEFTPEKLEIHGFTYRNRLYNVSRPNFQSRHHAQNTLNSRFHVKNDPKNASRKNVGGGAAAHVCQIFE